MNKSEFIRKNWTYFPGFIFLCILAVWIYVRCPSLSNAAACPVLVSWKTSITGSSAFIHRIVNVILAFFLFKAIHQIFILNILKKLSKYQDPERVEGKNKIVSVLWWILFWCAAISILVEDPKALIASLGLVGLGLTFALQKPILNIVGWLTILFKGIYRTGDRIEVGEIKGNVRQIGIMNTTVDSVLPNSGVCDLKSLFFPNEFVLSQPIKNYSKDSNYILDRITISITYESDHEKAMELLRDIVKRHIARNQATYKKRLNHEKEELDKFLAKLERKYKKKKTLENKEKIEDLKEEKEAIIEERNEIQSLSAEFEPNIHIELNDSSIDLLAQFMTPYDAVRKNRTAINLKFLKAIKRKKIEIAYPHIQIVK